MLLTPLFFIFKNLCQLILNVFFFFLNWPMVKFKLMTSICLNKYMLLIFSMRPHSF
ncbi:hypothetical protein HanRHA438_Chr11g0496361 [Helianthus annuus]|nr:hypothetical protein HanIR_Chr11g0520481 [Helianthus annuus]KAJ0870084.1 hypothetical protein HanRHA438_Chr11g0496361 [Helianthus annuus]